jgi:hypothetical protein
MKPDAVPARVVNDFLDLLVGPATPQALDDVILRAKFSGPRRKLFQPREGIVASVDVPPHRESRRDPGSAHPLRKKHRVRWRAEVREHVAVHERIQVATGDHHAPRRRDRAVDRSGSAEPLRLLATVAQFVRIIQRLTMTQPDDPAPAAIGLERHAGVVDEIRLGDHRVSGVAGQLDRNRWAGPLARLHRRDRQLLVLGLVVSAKIVKPHGRAFRDDEFG